MAGIKINTMIAAAVDRVEAQHRAERDEDVRAIIEFMEDELNNVRGSVELLQQRVEELKKQDEGNEASA